MAETTNTTNVAAPSEQRVGVKRYADGKATGWIQGNPAYAAEARAALERSLRVFAEFDTNRFISLMQERGVPGEVIAEYAASISLDDDVWLGRAVWF